jgi:hypothetical protein
MPTGGPDSWDALPDYLKRAVVTAVQAGDMKSVDETFKKAHETNPATKQAIAEAEAVGKGAGESRAKLIDTVTSQAEASRNAMLVTDQLRKHLFQHDANGAVVVDPKTGKPMVTKGANDVFGAVQGQAWYQPGRQFANPQASQLYEAINSRLNELGVDLTRAKFAGQGAVTDFERKLVSQITGHMTVSSPESLHSILRDIEELNRIKIARAQTFDQATGPKGDDRAGVAAVKKFDTHLNSLVQNQAQQYQARQPGSPPDPAAAPSAAPLSALKPGARYEFRDGKMVESGAPPASSGGAPAADPAAKEQAARETKVKAFLDQERVLKEKGLLDPEALRRRFDPRAMRDRVFGVQ